jgi:hypothetical protein
MEQGVHTYLDTIYDEKEAVFVKVTLVSGWEDHQQKDDKGRKKGRKRRPNSLCTYPSSSKVSFVAFSFPKYPIALLGLQFHSSPSSPNPHLRPVAESTILTLMLLASVPAEDPGTFGACGPGKNAMTVHVSVCTYMAQKSYQ